MIRMNNKLICVGAAAGAILAAALFSVNWDTGKVRFHQHLSSARQEEKETSSIEWEEFTSHLPIIEVNTKGQEIPGNWILDEEGTVIGTEVSSDGEEMISVGIRVIDSSEGKITPKMKRR